MRIFRNIACSIAALLIIVCHLFVYTSDGEPRVDPTPFDTNDSLPSPEVQSPVSSYPFAIKVNNSAQIITEVHKLSALNVLPNQLIPFDFDFRRMFAFLDPPIYDSPVPIFIRGHALLN